MAMRNQAQSQFPLYLVQIFLFFALWCFYGVLINSANLKAFGLQHAGIEAYVARHHFYLEGATDPRLQVQPVVDAFLFNGHVYAAKQPGQFMLGALIYFPLHAAGLNYSNNYSLTAALVTFLTASLVTALAAVFVFKIASALIGTSDPFWPLLISFSYGVGSTMLAYSGIPWHDTLATGYLIIAFYFVLRLAQDSERSHGELFAGGAGIFLGLTLTTSMLPSLMIVVVAIYFVSLKRWKLIVPFAGGAIIGLGPLLVYNTVSFGNPLLVPNVAGNYRDTFFHPSLTNFLGKLWFYSSMVTLYMPVLWSGLIGWVWYPKVLRREQITIVAMLLVQIIYLLNIEANGTCQYGPRYLLPAIPFAMLGMIGFSSLPSGSIRTATKIILIGLFAVSAFINIVGAMHGAMLCDFPHSAVQLYLADMLHGQMRSFPLAKALMLPLIIAAILLMLALPSLGKKMKAIKSDLSRGAV